MVEWVRDMGMGTGMGMGATSEGFWRVESQIRACGNDAPRNRGQARWSR